MGAWPPCQLERQIAPVLPSGVGDALGRSRRSLRKYMEWQCSDWNPGHSGLDAAARVRKAVGQVLEKHVWGNEMPS